MQAAKPPDDPCPLAASASSSASSLIPSLSSLDIAVVEGGEDDSVQENSATLPMEAILCFLTWKELIRNRLICKEWRGMIRLITPADEVSIKLYRDKTCRRDMFPAGLLRSLPKVERFALHGPLTGPFRRYLYRMPIECVQPISSLRNLKCLKICSLILKGKLPSLSHLSSLEELDTSWTSDLEWSFGMLSGLSSLKVIKCTRNHRLVGNLNEIQHLDKLTDLNLDDCNGVTGSLLGLGALRMLNHLSLYDCINVTGSLSHLRKLQKITYLNLGGCSNVTGSLSALIELRVLTRLHLDFCTTVTGSVLDLRGFSHLSYVSLQETGVTTANVREIGPDDFQSLSRVASERLVEWLETA